MQPSRFAAFKMESVDCKLRRVEDDTFCTKDKILTVKQSQIFTLELKYYTRLGAVLNWGLYTVHRFNRK
jgi:hypothetical protein